MRISCIKRLLNTQVANLQCEVMISNYWKVCVKTIDEMIVPTTNATNCSTTKQYYQYVQILPKLNPLTTLHLLMFLFRAGFLTFIPI